MLLPMFREEIVEDAAGRRKHIVTHKTPQNHGLADFQRKFKERRGSPAWRKAADYNYRSHRPAR